VETRLPASPTTKIAARLFISYSRKNKAQVYPFAEALAAADIDVWIDCEEIESLEDFPGRILKGLAQSHGLLAWYSPEYAQSSYCQKELTAAWICAQRQTRDVLSRILVVNPEESVAHIALGDVARQNYMSAPRDMASRAACIQSIRERLAGLSDDFGAVREFKRPNWYPSQQQGSARFVGRMRELWAVHTALNPVGISEHESPHVVVQVRGLGGVGKTLLAIEYARRFGASYPGGIHRLRAYGFDSHKPMDAEARERERQSQIENLALAYDVAVRNRDFREIVRDLGRKLGAGAPYLWIVDDLPPLLDQNEDFLGWCAPSPNGCTLITTRSGDYDGLGATIRVDVLDPESALELLTMKRKPRTAQELRDARELVEALGRHALALDVAGHFLLETRGFTALREAVTGSGSDPFGELAAGLSGQLPDGHEKSIVATLVASVRQLGERALTLLRLAGVLSGGTPVPLRLARGVFRHAFAAEEEVIDDYLTLAVNQSEKHSLATISPEREAFSVHSLVRYTMLHADPAGDRAPELREMLRKAAVQALVELWQAPDVRKHASIDLEIIHAKDLAPQPRNVNEVQLSKLLSSIEEERGHYREALAMANRPLPIQEQALGHYHPETLATRMRIANLTGASGEAREAVRLFKEVLPEMQLILGPDHPDTLAARSNLAHWTEHTGDHRKALCMFRELLPDVQRLLGADYFETLITRKNIASLIGKTGDKREALHLFVELLPDMERVRGHEGWDSLSIRSLIAANTAEAGEALRLYRELLPKEEGLMGLDHPDTLGTRRNIVFLTGKTGEVDEALRLFRELLPVHQRVLGPDHPDTLVIRTYIAFWTEKQGYAREALRLFRELLPDQEHVLGPDHPETLTTRNCIAKLDQI